MWKSLKHKAILARQLMLPEWLILLEAWWAMLGFYLALHWVSYDRLDISTNLIPDEMDGASSALVYAQRLQRLVNMASRMHLLSMTCLFKAFTLRWMLNRRGAPAQLRIGANKNSAGIHAHAWVEIGGQTLGESENIGEKFQVLSSIERTFP